MSCHPLLLHCIISTHTVMEGYVAHTHTYKAHTHIHIHTRMQYTHTHTHTHHTQSHIHCRYQMILPTTDIIYLYKALVHAPHTCTWHVHSYLAGIWYCGVSHNEVLAWALWNHCSQYVCVCVCVCVCMHLLFIVHNARHSVALPLLFLQAEQVQG